MFEEKISEAADALTRKQLGIEKSEDEKRDDFPKMFVQISSVFQIELMEQLNKISANMMQKYNLLEISPKTLDKIAEKIREEAESERISSISELSQNKDILAIAEIATENQIKLENSTEYDEENNANFSEESELKEKNQLDKAIENLRLSSKTKNEIHDLFQTITEENVSDVRNKIRSKIQSEEYRKEDEDYKNDAEYVLKHGNEEQKAQTLEELARREALAKRRSMTPEERRQKRFQVKSILFDFVVKGENNPDFECFRNEFEEYIAEEYAFDDDEILELKSLIDKAKNISDLQDIALDKICDLYKEHGKIIKNKEKFKERLLVSANKRTWTRYTESENKKDYATYDKDKKLDDYYQTLNEGVKNLNNREELFTETHSKLDNEFTEIYANMLLEDGDKQRLGNLFESLKNNETEVNMLYDFAILDKIKKVDKNFYYLALRQMKNISQTSKNTTLTAKIEEIIQKEIKEQSAAVTKDIVLRFRKSMKPEDQLNKRRGVSGVLQTFLMDCMRSNKSLEYQKSEILKYLKKEHGLSEKEKLEFYESISKAKSNDEFADVLANKMEEIISESGKKVDKEQLLRKAKKEPQYSEFQITTVRAKIVLDSQLYNQFLDFQDELTHGKTENDEKDYDYGFIEIIKQKDPIIYEALKERIMAISKKRDHDKMLKRLGERIEALDKSDDDIRKEIQEENELIANKIGNAINAKREKVEKKSGLKTTTEQTSHTLFNFMTRIFDEKYGTDSDFETVKKDVFEYVSQDLAFSIEETEEMLKKIINADRGIELGKVLAEKMVELAEKRGIPEKNILPNQIIGRAKERTQIKNLRIGSNGENIDRRSILLNRVYAKMFLNGEDRMKALEIIERMSDTSPNAIYDFSILDKIKNIDESFYYSMVRTVGFMANKTGKSELNDKYSELIAKELMEKNYNELDDLGKINARAKLVLDEGIYNRYKNFEESIIYGSPDGLYDEQLIEYIKGKDPNIYRLILSQMEKNAKSRNDNTLLDFIEKNKLKDKESEKDQTDAQDTSEKSILTVQNLKVDEVVIAHSEGIDMFNQKHKNEQTIDDTGDGR